MLKRVDNAATLLMDVKNGVTATAGGIQVLGLGQDGVGWALDDNTRA